MTSERPAAVAGLFYPGDASDLEAQVTAFLDDATSTGPVPKAIVVPHAGYVYSGPIAGSAYRRLRPAAVVLKRVVLLGPAHRIGLRGLGVPTVDAFRTPLGPVPVDREAVDALLDLDPVVPHDAAHAPEHSLEVHLPFLQVVLDAFEVVPVIVGEARTGEVAGALERVWGGPETVVVISTDLSHYHDYDTATAMDLETAERIEALDLDALDGRRACGFVGLKGLLEVARRRGLEIERLDLRNSGDTAGPADRVVGYGAWALSEPRSAA